jgi:archaellum biogenesis protein FlaJ (TadC family)
MKTINLDESNPTLNEVISLANTDVVLLRNSLGKMFVVSAVDEFDVEVEILKKNEEFMTFLRDLSQEKSSTSLKELREDLGL